MHIIINSDPWTPPNIMKLSNLLFLFTFSAELTLPASGLLVICKFGDPISTMENAKRLRSSRAYIQALCFQNVSIGLVISNV